MGNLVVGPIEPATNLGLSIDEYLAAAFFAIMPHFYLSHKAYQQYHIHQELLMMLQMY